MRPGLSGPGISIRTVLFAVIAAYRGYSRYRITVLYVYETAGEDVLAIGTDGKLDISSSDKLYLLYEALGKKGMKPSVLDKMWYKNAERVLLSAEV